MSNEKRFGSDRRASFRNVKFPFQDSNGRLVACDRRVNPDRRLSNIKVEWITEKKPRATAA